jgi:hypothetical protein
MGNVGLLQTFGKEYDYARFKNEKRRYVRLSGSRGSLLHFSAGGVCREVSAD